MAYFQVCFPLATRVTFPGEQAENKLIQKYTWDASTKSSSEIQCIIRIRVKIIYVILLLFPFIGSNLPDLITVLTFGMNLFCVSVEALLRT